MNDPNEEQRAHTYHAEAFVLEGSLQLPLANEIERQASAQLHPKGGYLAQHAPEYKLEGAISYRKAYTQVAGNNDTKDPSAWNTLCTSVVEGLNVLDVLTADRVVAQVNAVHPAKGYVPAISFLGTRFENLRIAGHDVELEIDPCLFGAKPKDDMPHGGDEKLLKQVASQYERIRSQGDAPAEVLKRYLEFPQVTPAKPEEDDETGVTKAIDFSLVHNAPGKYPGRCFGHVIDVPNFGQIYLATLCLEETRFKKNTGIPKRTTVTLHMIELKLGCAASGTGTIGSNVVNGMTQP